MNSLDFVLIVLSVRDALTHLAVDSRDLIPKNQMTTPLLQANSLLNDFIITKCSTEMKTE